MTDTGKKRSGKEKGRQVLSVPIGRILPNPTPSRRSISEEGLIRLADSIMRHGVLQPLTVRVTDEECLGRRKRSVPMVYELISGDRRLRAAKMAGLTEVPCIVVEANDRRAAELTVAENVGREPLSYFDEANAMATLIDVYGLSQDETAGVFALPRGALAQKLRLLRLTAQERMLMVAGGLSERHARALLKICDSEKRLEVLKEVAKLSLNVCRTEELVDKVLCPDAEKPKARRKLSIKDVRIVINTIEKTLEEIEKNGVPIERQRRDGPDSVEIVIKVKKGASMSPVSSPELTAV